MTDRRAISILLGAFLLYALVTFYPWSGQGPDGNGYYRWASSLIFDGDWGMAHDFVNCGYQPQHIIQDLNDILPSGNHPNAFSVGPGLIWSTALAPFVGVERLIHGAAWWSTVDAYAWRYRVLVSLVTVTLACHAIILLFHCLRAFFSPGISFTATALTAFGTSLTYYMTLEPAMSHTHVFWAVTILWWLSIRLWKREENRSLWEDWALGMAVGLTALMRWQAILWVLVPALVYIAQLIRGPRRGRVLLGILLSAVASVVVFSPQFVAWKTLYGGWVVIPQGQGFLLNQSLAFFNVLFAKWNGLFTSHPWLLLGLVGLIPFIWRAPTLAIGAWLALGAMWVVNASVSDWWAGDSFGARRWCNALPALAFGFAGLLALIPKRPLRSAVCWVLLLIVIPLNITLVLLYFRGAVREYWIGNLPLVGEILPLMLADPKQWIVGIMGSMLLWPCEHSGLAIALAALISCAIAPFAFVLITNAAPWPRGRLAKVMTTLFMIYVGIALSAGLWSMSRSPHPDVHRRIDEAIDPHSPYSARWAAINAPGFEIDHTCPVHLTTAAHLALINGEEERGQAMLHELEAMCPRQAQLMFVEYSHDPEVRRAALGRILANPRLGDDYEINKAINTSLEMEDFALFDQLAQIPTASPLVLSSALARYARHFENAEAEEHHLHITLLRKPDDIGCMLRIAELREAAGDTDEAQRLRQTARHWCDVKLDIVEQLSAYNPLIYGIMKGPEAGHWVRSRLNLLDPISEADLYMDTFDRGRIILEGHPQWLEVQRDMLYDMLDVIRRDPPDSVAAQLMQWFGEQVHEHPNSLEHWEVFIEAAGLVQGVEAALDHLTTAVGMFPDMRYWDHTLSRAFAHVDASDFERIAPERWAPSPRGWALLGLARRASDLGENALALHLAIMAKEEGLQLDRLPETAHFYLMRARDEILHTPIDTDMRDILGAMDRHMEEFPEDADAGEAIDEIRAHAETVRQLRTALASPEVWSGIDPQTQSDMIEALRQGRPRRPLPNLIEFLDYLAHENTDSIDAWELLIELAGQTEGIDRAVDYLAEAVDLLPDENEWDYTILRSLASTPSLDPAQIDPSQWPERARGWALLGMAHRAGQLSEDTMGLQFALMASEAGLTIERVYLTAHHFMIRTWHAAVESPDAFDLHGLLTLLHEYANQFPQSEEVMAAIEEIEALPESSEHGESVEAATEAADVAP